MSRKSLVLVSVLVVGVLLAVSLYDTFDPNVDLKDKRVIVCGASTGIGEQIAYLYARAGARLVLVSRRLQVLQQVQAKCRDLGAAQVEVFAGDLSFKNTSKGVIEYSEEKLGGFDHLILNHVIGYYTVWSSKSDLDYATKVVEVDLLSYIYLTTYSLPALERSHGSVVAVSSAVGLSPLALTHVYSASKFGLHGFFGSLRQDLMIQKSNVSISLVALGLFGTDNTKANTKDKLPDVLKMYGDPADAAYAIARTATLRLRQCNYPYAETKLLQWVHSLFPSLVDGVMVHLFQDRLPHLYEGQTPYGLNTYNS
ncbi:hydroxysteroid 11-beta-dehydrogenase 1-like protein [Sycon ciliatum]|uniref:hydroxysteroid 11-beta-dehydrogenase 1-like protein n=1 Tax=Sycon ciliatum TaxID=27933 RepID=UPI0031F5F92A